VKGPAGKSLHLGAARLRCALPSGRSAAWLAHLTGGQGVAGSNPVAPTVSTLFFPARWRSEKPKAETDAETPRARMGLPSRSAGRGEKRCRRRGPGSLLLEGRA